MISGPPGAFVPPAPFQPPDQATYDALKKRPTVLISGHALTSSKLVYGGPLILVGYSIRETAGAVAAIRAWNGGDNPGDLVISVSLVANASASEAPGVEGPFLPSGLFFEVVSGAVGAAIWAKI